MSDHPSTATPAKRSQRVKSWLYGVINPLIESMETEISLLRKGDATFRADNGRVAYMRPIEGYLARATRHILRDFLCENADASAHFERHDEAVREFEDACQNLHAALVAHEPFRRAVEEATRRIRGRRPPAPPAEVSESEVDLEDAISTMAEFVVNSRETVREYATAYADIWNQAKGQLRPHTGWARLDVLQRAREHLVEADEALQSWLEQKSLDLCREYDLPAAPTPLSPE